MNNFILNFNHEANDLASSLGIEKDRLGELGNMFKKILNKEVSEGDDLSISNIIEQVSFLDITNEEYTFIILQLGMIIKELKS